MAIPASKVRSVCTSSETALVRASRKPVLEELSPADLKRNAARAKKLFDKWQDLSRTHARGRSEKVGFGETDANTQLKAEIFGEALKNFETRLAKLESTKGSAAKGAGSKTKKKDRNVDHRASRAAVRKGMSAVEDLLNAPARKKKKLAASKSAPAAAPAAPASPAAAATLVKSAKPKQSKPSVSVTNVPPTKLKVKGLAQSPADQRKAMTAAKKSRVVRSGKTTRTLGHVVARGKRAQARRDSKG